MNSSKQRISYKTQQPKNYSLSQYIVSKTIRDQIIAKTVADYIPKQIVYFESAMKANQIQKNIVKMINYQPDASPEKINNIQDLKTYPTSFKVKKNIVNIKLQPRNILKKQKRHKISMSLNSLNRLSSGLQIKEKFDHQNNYQNKIKSQMRLFPSSSTHQIDRKVSKRIISSNYKLKQCQYQNDIKDIDGQEQVIRALRQKVNFSQFYTYNLEKLGSTKKLIEKEPNKKNKDNQVKGILLTTDYDGCWVNITKNDLARQAPHFIDVDIEVLQNQSQQNVKRNPSFYRQSTDYLKQFVNFKDYKIANRQSSFLQNTIKKVKSLQKSGKQFQNQIQIANQKKQDNSQVQIKFTGKTYQPTKVGFNVYQKMKKTNWKIRTLQQQNKKQQIVLNNTDTTMKKSQLKYIKEKKELTNQLNKFNYFQINFKNNENISLGNLNAFNYLVNPDRKNYKKTVTINQDNVCF